MPATERETRTLDLIAHLLGHLPVPDAGSECSAAWVMGFAHGLRTVRDRMVGEIAYRDSVDEGVPGYVAVPGVGGEKSAVR